VRSEAAELNNKLIHIRSIATEKERLEELLVETKRALDEVLVESQNDLSRAIEIIALGKVPDGPIEDKRKPLALGAAVFVSLGTLALVIASSVLAGVVKFSDDLDDRSREILATVIKEDSTADDFREVARKIRNELDLRWPQPRTQPLILAVLGTGEEVGVTTVTRAMGEHYASAGRRVLLIDADASDNGLSRPYQGDEVQGARAIARGETPLEEAVRKVNDADDALWLLPCPRPAHVAGPQRQSGEMAVDELKCLLDAARAEYDVVIIDLGVLTAGGQSAVGAALADRSVLVSASGDLRRNVTGGQALLNRLANNRYLLAMNRALPIDPVFSTARTEREQVAVGGRERIRKLLQS
jgi:Mrp family chromosome partitioning ATPase